MNDEPRNSQSIPGVDAGKASDESIVRAHARIRRQPVAASPVAFFTSVALIIVFVFGWFYARRYFLDSYFHDREQVALHKAFLESGGAEAAPVAVDGAKLFAQQCQACHGATGQGVPGAFPPLAGSEWVTGEAELPIRIALAGLSGQVTVKGQTFNGVMPGFGPVWNDAEIAAVVTYVRASWDNGAGAVTPEEVAAVRAAIGTRGPWTAAELQDLLP